MNSIDESIITSELAEKEIQNSSNSGLAEAIRKLVTQQAFGVLCTQGQAQPYGSLIAYAFTDNLQHFFFTTPMETRKFKLLSECPQVALLIDSRCQHPHDMSRIAAVTITGKAIQIHSAKEYDQGIQMLRTRHPYLAEFMESASSALFRIDTVHYLYVTRFQEVSQWIR